MKRLLFIILFALAGCSTLVTESTPDTVIVDVRGRNDSMRADALQKAAAACAQYGKVAANPVIHDRGVLQDGAHWIVQYDCVKPPTQ